MYVLILTRGRYEIETSAAEQVMDAIEAGKSFIRITLGTRAHAALAMVNIREIVAVIQTNDAYRSPARGSPMSLIAVT